jgi:hypothetical protein
MLIQEIDFNLTNIANSLDIPGLRDLVYNITIDSMSKILVLPNRLVIPIIPDFDAIDLNSFRHLQPIVILELYQLQQQQQNYNSFILFHLFKFLLFIFL